MAQMEGERAGAVSSFRTVSGAARSLTVPAVSNLKSWLLSLWREPPPAPGRAVAVVDVGVAVGFVVLAVVELWVRGLAAVGGVGSVAVCGAVCVAVAWRRAQPARAFFGAFGVVVAVDVGQAVAGVHAEGLYTSAAVLLLPYALVRHGAGRAALLGLGALAVVYVVAIVTDGVEGGDRVGAAVVLLLPVVLGFAVRAQAQAQRRALELVREREREQLARDLHDTVAHHVSAIVIQAQAGRFGDVDAARRALVAIEGEASLALTELRGLVGLLRDGAAPLAPTAAGDLSALSALARRLPDGRVVDVDGVDDVDGPLHPVVAAAIFRIAQEAVTNALRHARGATRIAVSVRRAGERVTLTVVDDGAPAAAGAGFGLVGMRERAALVGGTCTAGPVAKGWRVEAQLPRAPRAPVSAPEGP